MRLRELTGRLDDTFRPDAFDEHDGWGFCFAPGEWAALLARAPAAFAATCNGLMIAPAAADPEATRVYLLAFPRPELLALDAAQVRHAGRPVARVAVVAGGDDVETLREVLATEADTYLTGTWWTPHESAWSDQNRAAVRALLPECSFNLLGTSHNASEQVVLRDRLAPLIRGWGIEAVWLPCAET